MNGTQNVVSDPVGVQFGLLLPAAPNLRSLREPGGPPTLVSEPAPQSRPGSGF